MSKNTIVLKDYAKVRNEFAADVEILPGEVVNLNSDGEAALADSTDLFISHLVAVEDELQGKGITDAYAAGEPVQIGVFREGDELYMRLAKSQTVSIGDVLTPSAADHGLVKGLPAASFLALEAVTTTGAATGWIMVMVVAGFSDSGS